MGLTWRLLRFIAVRRPRQGLREKLRTRPARRAVKHDGIIPTTTDPTKTWVRQAYIFTYKTPTLGTGEHPHGPGAAYLVGDDGTVHRKNPADEAPLPPGLIGDYWAAHMLRDVDVPVAVRALQARDAVVSREDAEVDRFASEVLGLWRGGRWREPVSTALLGNWATPLKRRVAASCPPSWMPSEPR